MARRKPKKGKPNGRSGNSNQPGIMTNQQSNTSTLIQQTTVSSGPLPSPETLARFDQVLPGLAQQIADMAAREAEHRHQQESTALAADIEIANKDRTEALLGQIFGFLIGLTTIFCGTYLAANGHYWPGSIIGTTGVVGLVSAFIVGRSKQTNHTNH